MENIQEIVMETKQDEELKKEKQYNMNLDKDNNFNVIIKNYPTYIEIEAINQKNDQKKYTEKYSLNKLKENKFLSICESVDDMYDELLLLFSKSNYILTKFENKLNIIIPTEHAKYKEISFVLKGKQKTYKESYEELYNIISQLQKENKDKDEKINICNQEINNLKKEIVYIKNQLDILNENIKNRIDKTNKPIIKNINLNEYEVIENPWTKESDGGKLQKNFLYILEDNGYLASKNDSNDIYTIKAKCKFEKNYMYKIIYYINFIDDLRVGFGNTGVNTKRLKEKGSVGLTKEGLFIEGIIANKEIKINENSKEIIFIINLKDNKSFEVFIDGKSFGTFNFNLEIIYGLAAFRKGSVKIKTLRYLN